MSTNLQPVIRDAQLADAPAMIDLLEAAYPRWPPVAVEASALEHLRWKMTPPGDVPLHHAVVEIGDRIAAMQLRWVGRFQIGHRNYIGEEGADLAVHPDFRGQGLSRLIKSRDQARLAAGQITGIGILSNAPQVRHMNAPDLINRPMTTWTRPFRWRSYAAVHYRDGGPLHLLGALFRRATQRGDRPELPHRIEVLEQFDERVDELWESARQTFDVIRVRDHRYLNWRLAPPLAGNPTILALQDGDRMLAYIVARRREQRGDILDWLWLPEAERALPALLQAAIDRLRADGASDVTCWLPDGHRAEPVLRTAGLAPVGTQTLLFDSRDQPVSPPEVLDVFDDPTTTMHLTMSDFDFV